MMRVAFGYDDLLYRHILRRAHALRPVRLGYTHEQSAPFSVFDGNPSSSVYQHQTSGFEKWWSASQASPLAQYQLPGVPDGVGRWL